MTRTGINWQRKEFQMKGKERSLKEQTIAQAILTRLPKRGSGIIPLTVYGYVVKSLNLIKNGVTDVINVSETLVKDGHILEHELESKADGTQHTFWKISEKGLELSEELSKKLVPKSFQVIIDEEPTTLPCFGPDEQVKLADILQGTFQAQISITTQEPFEKTGNFKTLLKVVRALFGDESSVLISFNNVLSNYEEPEKEVAKFFE